MLSAAALGKVSTKAQAPGPLLKGWTGPLPLVTPWERERAVVDAFHAIQKAEFFPLEPNQIENASPQTVKATAQGAQITMAKSDQLLKPISSLKGVLVLADGSAYQVQARVTQR